MKTGFIGVGSMGGMLVRAFLRSGQLAPESVWVANRSQPKLDALSAAFPGLHVASNRRIAGECNLIFLSVAPADTDAVLTEIVPILSPKQLFFSTDGRTPLQLLEGRVPCRVGKLIPSITQEIGAGIAVLMYGSRVTSEDRALMESLLAKVSQPVVIPEELARPTIGLTSGGPAMLAYILQSMTEEAVRSNPQLSADLARELVEDTALATARLMTEGKFTTEEVIRRVAHPGGRTVLAIEALSRHLPQAWRAVFQEPDGTRARPSKARNGRRTLSRGR